MVGKRPVGRSEEHLPLLTEVPSANENETSVLGEVRRTDEFFDLDSQRLGGTAPMRFRTGFAPRASTKVQMRCYFPLGSRVSRNSETRWAAGGSRFANTATTYPDLG